MRRMRWMLLVGVVASGLLVGWGMRRQLMRVQAPAASRPATGGDHAPAVELARREPPAAVPRPADATGGRPCAGPARGGRVAGNAGGPRPPAGVRDVGNLWPGHGLRRRAMRSVHLRRPVPGRTRDARWTTASGRSCSAAGRAPIAARASCASCPATRRARAATPRWRRAASGSRGAAIQRRSRPRTRPRQRRLATRSRPRRCSTRSTRPSS